MAAIVGRFLDAYTRNSFDLPDWVDSEKFYLTKRRELHETIQDRSINLGPWCCALVSFNIDIGAGEGIRYYHEFPKELVDLICEIDYDDINWDGDVLPEIAEIVSRYTTVPKDTSAVQLIEIIKRLKGTDLSGEFLDLLQVLI